eukprot:6868845-Pyramimonas_sp.AAC.1
MSTCPAQVEGVGVQRFPLEVRRHVDLASVGRLSPPERARRAGSRRILLESMACLPIVREFRIF